MIPILALALAFAVEPHCSIQRPAECAGTDELAASPGFERAVRRFVGVGRASWYAANAGRARQLLDVVRGPSVGPVAVGTDLLRFDACYPHICTIRAALFVARGGGIRGAALIYPDCPRTGCSGDEGLRVTFLRDSSYPDVAGLARHWAEEDVAASNARYSFAREAIARVEVRDVPDSARRPNRARRVNRPPS
jgi:hypothetical protein